MSITLPGINIPSRTIDFGGLATNEFLILLVVGLIAGVLASRVVGVGGGLFLDMVVGVIGAFLGHWLFGVFNINLGPGVIPLIIVAFVGAALLLLIVRGLSGGSYFGRWGRFYRRRRI
ncbi:MAG TPA: GlsB/YeaQ/YmgE family stress response membrane protein [Candidatus Dormibacteraeota bacterium]|nr:GlsB/YeaQ/YmgE family stress response membrane protein [Candidatus Dormibacteraeota bacterium]